MLPDNWNELTADQRNNWLRDALKEDLSVTFTKVDGTERTMPCTLREGIIPAKPVDIGSKSNEKRLANMNVLSVWCLDKQEWRSFRINNVISKNFTIISNNQSELQSSTIIICDC